MDFHLHAGGRTRTVFPYNKENIENTENLIFTLFQVINNAFKNTIFCSKTYILSNYATRNATRNHTLTFWFSTRIIIPAALVA